MHNVAIAMMGKAARQINWVTEMDAGTAHSLLSLRRRGRLRLQAAQLVNIDAPDNRLPEVPTALRSN